MQHPDEAARVIEVGDHRVLVDLEAHLRGRDPAGIEALDHVLEKLCVPERLTGHVDGDAAPGRHRDRPAPEGGERRLHHPAVHQPHQPVAFGGPHELRGRQLLTGLVLQPHQHLHRRPPLLGVRRNDHLLVQVEAVFLERALQALQPLDLTGVAGEGLIARRVHHHPPAALFLGDVAGGIGGRQQLFQRAALARDLHQTHRHAAVEDLVLPHEAVFAHRAGEVIGDLPRLVQRTADQQRAELVTAEAPDRVAVAHRVAQQLGDLAQHAVPGEVTAGVVDELEAIEVEITQHVLAIAAVAALDRLRQAPLELAAIDETGERVVRRLVRHLAGEAAHFGDVMQQHHCTEQLLGAVADGRSRQLDGALAAVGARQQQRPAAQVDGCAGGERLVHRIGQQPPVGLVDETHDLLEELALGRARAAAGELLGGGVQEADAAVLVGGDDRLRQ